MNLIKTLTAASAIAVAMSSNLVTAWDASVTFYQDAFFSGPAFKVLFSTSQKCFNIGCFNDRASSVHWEGIPANNIFGTPNHIAFYKNKDCYGDYKEWRSQDIHPQDFKVDGINDQVSSFMVIETVPYSTSGTHLVCPFSTMAEESEQLATITVVDATEATIQKANATASHQIN